MFEWTLMKRLIWIKAAIISGAASLYETVTGAIVSFVALHAKALKKLVVNIEPVQDLHGYAAPWPPGGRDNILDFSSVSGSNATISGTAEDFTITATSAMYNCAQIDVKHLAGKGIFYISGKATRTGVSANASCFQLYYNDGTTHYIALAAYTNNFCDAVDLPFSVPSGVTTARISIFANNYASGGEGITVNVQNLRISTKTGTTWTPYANECPISGWTGVNVWATGGNVWDEETVRGSVSSANGIIYINPSASSLITKNFIPIKPETLYIVSTAAAALSSFNTRTRFYDVEKNYIGYTDYSGGTIRYNVPFKTPEKACYLMIEFQAEYGTIYNNDISVNYPDTNTEYHAYSGATRQIIWQDEAGTVYGGTVTVKEDGSVDLKRLKAYALLSDKTKWIVYSGGSVNYLYNVPFTRKIYADSFTGLLCSVFAISISSYPYGRWRGADSLYFGINDNNEMLTLEQIQELAENNKIAICYDIEPVTYHLDSIAQLVTQVGTNNIWADAGDVEVTYYAK